MSENTNPETPYSGDPVPEPSESAAYEPTPDFLSLSDAAAATPEPTEFSAVEDSKPADPIQAPPGLDLGNPEEVAQVTYGQTQDSYAEQPPAQPDPQFGYVPPAQPDPQTGYVPPAQPDPQAAYAPPPPPPMAAGYPQTVASQLTPQEENTWAGAAHWSALVTTLVGLGFLGPLLIMLIKGPESPRVRAAAVESLNFEITYIIAMIISSLAMFIFIGFITIFVFPIVWLVLRIMASVAASRGENYRYPVNIRMVS